MLGEYLDDAYNSWLGDALSCCSPRLKHDAANQERRGAERHMIIEYGQPRLVPEPLYETPPRPSTRASSSRELLDRGRNYASQASKRGAFSVRRKLNAYNGFHHSRRPQIGRPMQISNPSEFQHVGMAIPRRNDRFRPLQLSIYMPDNRLSPILPHFRDFGDDDFGLSYPPQAMMMHSRSGSALSTFTIPRKPVSSSIMRLDRRSSRNSVDEHESPSSTASEWALQPLKPPPRIPESPSTQELMAALEAQLPKAPPAARLQSITETPRLVRTAEQYGRVKSALIERQELDEQLRKLDTIIEQRQSLYLSRSSRATSIYNHEPIPRPSLPNTREVSTPVQVEERPKTATGIPNVRIPHRATNFKDASAAFNSHPPVSRQVSHDQLSTKPLPPPSHTSNHRAHSSHGSHVSRSAAPPPPLPLMLQSPSTPPRKSSGPRRSFSRSRRVSNWLFPGSGNTEDKDRDQHRRTVSNESITNTPRPVTSKEGFYQCLDYNTNTNNSNAAAASNRSLSTVLTQAFSESDIEADEEIDGDGIFESDVEEEGTRTAPTMTWSPGSSPGRASGSESGGMAMRKEMDLHVQKMRSFDDVEVESVVDDKEVGGGEGFLNREVGGWSDERSRMVVRPNRTSVGVAF